MNYSYNKICKMCGVTSTVLRQDIIMKKIPDATLEIGKQWRYTEDELKIIQEFYKDKPKRDMITKAQLRRQAGFYSITDIGKVTGFSHFVIGYHIRHKHIECPKIKVENIKGYFYDQITAQNVIEVLLKLNGGKGGGTYKERKTLKEL